MDEVLLIKDIGEDSLVITNTSDFINGIISDAISTHYEFTLYRS